MALFRQASAVDNCLRSWPLSFWLDVFHHWIRMAHSLSRCLGPDSRGLVWQPTWQDCELSGDADIRGCGGAFSLLPLSAYTLVKMAHCASVASRRAWRSLATRFTHWPYPGGAGQEPGSLYSSHLRRSA